MMTEVLNAKKVQSRKNGKHKPRPLGPVENMDQYVEPDWWRGIFNSLYLKTDGDVVDDHEITRGEIDKIVEVLRPEQNVAMLDLCCGHGRHTMELYMRGFRNVEGLDRSHYLISRARKTARSHGCNVKFREGDARKLPYATDSFDFILVLGNSFGYFETVRDDVRVLREIFRTLKPSGKLLIDITDGDYQRDNFKPRSWEWIDKKRFVCRERSLSIDSDRLISRELITDLERGVIADQFYAERLYTKDSLTRLLLNAGFSDAMVHGELVTCSQRNQDLGMMEQRLIVTAQVRKEWSSRRPTQGTKVKPVAVILGDPTKPDPLKPCSVFDEDDFYTIDQMKSALSRLSEYSFVFLNSHDSLVEDIRKAMGKVDFFLNLCDEGFNNDPKKELHVAALLEQMGAQYTGGTPQCLAYCYDKSLVRGIAKEMGIGTPDAFFVQPEDTAFDLPFDFPVIVKPNFGDSSFGITQRSVAYSSEQLLNAISEIREKFGYEKPMVVEEYLTGKDLTIGIIGNPPSDYTVLSIIEEDYSCLPDHLPRICGYEAKWDPSSPCWKLKSVPAELTPETKEEIVSGSLKLFERLECRDYARFDWRLSESGRPKLLEANPNPGWCWDGHLAKMAAIDDVSYSEMLKMILSSAEQRMRDKT